jgi:hypothetical protein
MFSLLCYDRRMTALVMFFKPWLMLAFFACLVIPLRLIILRIVPRSWLPLLTAEAEPWQQISAMVVMVLTIALTGLLAT